MENPFSRNGCWYKQPNSDPFSHSPSFGVYQLDPAMETQRTGRPVRCPVERNSGAKVVQIPVHFVKSEQVGRSVGALKIQKVFRGFLVRKSLKKIKDIKIRVDEIEQKLLKNEVVELVRRNEKDRLHMNETLMSLLFKLDSICGVDFGVRGCRKAVIRKAIALQERIDDIVAVDFQENCEIIDREAKSGEIVSAEVEDSSNHIINPEKPNCPSENAGNLESCVEYKEISGDNIRKEIEENDGKINIIDVGVDREVKVISEPNCVGDDDVIHEKSDLVEKDENGKQGKSQEAADNKRNWELLERMMEDNEKVMKLMSQLFERNEMQTKMLNVLMHRVEMLEKASVCDGKPRRRRKKKQHAAACCRED